MKKKVKILVYIFLGIYLFSLLPVVWASTNYQIIRVRISISRPEITVGVNGEYFIAEKPELVVPRGQYTVSVAGNNVRIRGNGIDQTIGSTLTFIRLENTGGGTNHFTVTDTVHGNVNYLGNMRFHVNSPNLVVTNHVPLEEYLYGVVAHEMSNSFPLEALKVQAVSARSYAVRSFSPSRDFDIGDTATTQVYKGFNPNHTRVISAVDQTKGQVLTFGGQVAETFYSASNGGHMELPGNVWGGGSTKNSQYPYLVQKEDPYDLRNPASLVQELFVPAVVTGSAYDAADSGVGGDFVVRATVDGARIRSSPDTDGISNIIANVNTNSVFPWLETLGEWFKINYNGQEAYMHNSVSQRVENGRLVYSSPVLTDFQNRVFSQLRNSHSINTATDIKINRVNSFVNHQERWPGTGSKSYVSARAELTVQYYSNGGASLSAETPVTVTIALMNQNSTGGYINAHDYLNSNLRLRSVAPAEGGYKITCVRYGHGVGMSQRGAQQMANEGKTYQEILAFYFEGTQIATLNTTAPGLPSRGDTNPPAGLNSSVHRIHANSISGVQEKTSVAGFLANFEVNEGSIELRTADGKEKTSGVVATGDMLYVKDTAGQLVKAYPVIIFGDVNGDGAITIADLLMIQRHLLDVSKLSGAYLTAADVAQDGGVKIVDLLRVQRHLLDVAKISQ